MDEVVPKPLTPEALAGALAGAMARLSGAQVAPAVRETLQDLGPEATRALLRLMLERLAPEVEALAAAVQEGRHEEVERRAHQLKGAVGNFALPALLEALSAVSRQTDQPGPEALPRLRAAAAEAEHQLRRSLSALDDQAALRTAAQ